MFVNIDRPGMKRQRRAVTAIQHLQGSADRKAAAQAKRDRKKAKRAGGDSVIVFSLFPKGGAASDDPDGAYVQGGVGFDGGRYQIVVVGPLKATVQDYCRALSAWLQKPMRLVSCETLLPPDDAEGRQRYEQRGGLFLSIILEPGET